MDRQKMTANAANPKIAKESETKISANAARKPAREITSRKTPRAYTYQEIQDMRRYVSDIIGPNNGYYHKYSDQAAAIEDQLRTYIMACVEPEELKKEAESVVKQRVRSQKQYVDQQLETMRRQAKMKAEGVALSETSEIQENQEFLRAAFAETIARIPIRSRRPTCYDTRYNSPPIKGTLC